MQHLSFRHLSISVIYQPYLSCYLFDFDQILNIGSWDLYEHIPTVTMTSVQAILVLATFVHIRNISAVTDPFLTEVFGAIFPGRIKILFRPKFFIEQNFFWTSPVYKIHAKPIFFPIPNRLNQYSSPLFFLN